MNARGPVQPEARAGVSSATLEVLPEAILIHDEQSVLFANASCRRLVGASSAEEIEGRSLHDFVHPDGLVECGRHAGLFLGSDRTYRDVPVKFVTLDGSTRRLKIDTHPLTFDGARAAMIVAPAQAV